MGGSTLQGISIVLTLASGIFAGVAAIRSRPLKPDWGTRIGDHKAMFEELIKWLSRPLTQLRSKIEQEDVMANPAQWRAAVIAALDQITQGLDDLYARVNKWPASSFDENAKAASDRMLIMIAVALAFAAAVLQILSLAACIG